MNFHKKLILLVFMILTTISIKAQNVTDITSILVGNNIHVFYKIENASYNQKFRVSLHVSSDGGKTFKGPMTLLNNKDELLLSGKHLMIWDVFKDINSLDKEFIFDIRATVINEKIKKHFFIQYSAGALVSSMDYITPIGFRLGIVGKTGFYLAGYINTFENPAYYYNGDMMTDEVFYEFTEKKLYPRMVITGGLTFQMNKRSHWFIGAGYATKKYYVQINELDVDGNIIQSNQWVNITEEEEEGIELETGFLINFSPINISLGVSTFNFKHVGANIGIGVVF